MRIESFFALLPIFLLVNPVLSLCQTQQQFLLDFGPGDVSPEDRYIKIYPEEHDSPVQWMIPPDTSYHRKGLDGIRAPAWRDGIGGDSLKFGLDLAPGSYWLQAVFEAGLQDEPTLQVLVDGEAIDLGWQAFTPPSEPRETAMKHFRVMQTQVSQEDSLLVISTINPGDRIGLTSLICLPVTHVDSPRQRWLWQRIQLAGKMDKSGSSLEFLKADLYDEIRENKEDNAWASWWWKQIDLMDRAEVIFSQRGWEWAKLRTGMSMIQRAQQAVMLLDGILAVEEHPLSERARWLRGKVLYHLDMQYHGQNESSRAQKDFSILLNRFPHHQILRMYMGEMIPSEGIDATSVTVSSLAPVWSQKQLVALRHLKRLVHYWVVHRQADNGELGGKLGDDVEALRFWTPMVHLNDSVTVKGWMRLADCVWYSPLTYDGFARDISDVEHAAEFMSDTAPLLLLMSDDTMQHARVQPLLPKFRDLWTGNSPGGLRLFKSAWYSSTELDERPPRDRDVQYNARTLKGLRYWLWRYPDDLEVRQLMYEWAKSWAVMSMKNDKSKPVGIPPPAVRLSDESINGDEPSWYRANMFWRYFDYRGDGLILDHLLTMWIHTGDSQLLEPIEASLQLIRDHYNGKPGIAGSNEWAADLMVKNSSFWGVAGQWRLLTGNKAYDELLLNFGPPYVRYRISGDPEYLGSALRDFNEGISFNWPMLTSEVYYTDRIRSYHRQAGYSLDVEVLKSMLTGDVSHNSTSPYVHVTWENTFDGFTGLVTDASRTRLQVEIFNHSSSEEKVVLRFWYLQPGKYTYTVNGNSHQLEIDQPGDKLTIACHPQKTLKLDFKSSE